MCTGKVGEALAKTTPHRLLRLPSYLDPMLHPDSKYNQPKVIPYQKPQAKTAMAMPTPVYVGGLIGKRRTTASLPEGSGVIPIGGG